MRQNNTSASLTRKGKGLFNSTLKNKENVRMCEGANPDNDLEKSCE